MNRQHRAIVYFILFLAEQHTTLPRSLASGPGVMLYVLILGSVVPSG